MRSKTLLKPTDKKEKATTIGFVVFLIVLVILFIPLRTYHFMDTFLFPLWPATLGFGVLIGTLMTYLLKASERWNNVKIFFIMTFLGVFFAGSMIAHLNHYLDPHEPVSYTVVIEDKDYSKRRKGMSKYEFTVTIDGKTFDIDVPGEHYRSCQTGDLYVIEYHTGAFDEPYYIGVGKASDKTPPLVP